MENYLLDHIEEKIEHSGLQSYKNLYRIKKQSDVKIWLYAILLFLVVVAFLPWTQNIRAKGMVTTLRQEQRPQELNTIIAGRVVKWYIKEGDYVQAGDTLLQLGEVKPEYFDPKLLERTKQQILAKQLANQGYASKAHTAIAQMEALKEGRNLKISQLDNKIRQQYLKLQSDSMDLVAVINENLLVKRQVDAAKLMLDSGVISLTEYEKRKISFQNSAAKKIGSENKFLQSKQELNNLFLEKNSTIQEYTYKISKAEGERFSSLSNQASGEADLSKLENSYSNYDQRNRLYYIVAPQRGQITKAKKAGLGEMLKEGEMIAEIVPNEVQHAIELFVEPMDLPLISVGQKVRFVFDGFPALVFSGWPKSSYGTFGGLVSSIESSVNSNGKFRVLVVADPKDKPWPQQLSIGGGANGIALLKDVRIWYELWRNINGFPPEYYQSDNAKETKKK